MKINFGALLLVLGAFTCGEITGLNSPVDDLFRTFVLGCPAWVPMVGMVVLGGLSARFSWSKV